VPGGGVPLCEHASQLYVCWGVGVGRVPPPPGPPPEVGVDVGTGIIIGPIITVVGVGLVPPTGVGVRL